ncbi:nucleotidyltransferase domain-containing protein [Alishewanella sp. d11]|uniref:nucleotidyltransferase domain-containing protein n=1 Tax=Alishewanella sp. d11 TaxID=3414030 RepID=UPI003BF831A1
MKFGLSNSDLAKMNNVFARHPQIEQVVLYGSRAKGNYRTGSDIDLTILGIDTNDFLLSRVVC